MNLRNFTCIKNAFDKTIIIKILLLLLLPACQQPERKTFIALLYDVSGSTRNFREFYLNQTLKIIENVPHNSEIFINRITDASIQSSDWIVFEYKTKELKNSLDYLSYLFSFNENREKKEKKIFVDSILREIQNIVLQDSYIKTDIMSALYIAGKSFENSNGYKHIFVFTDGLENAKIFDKRKMSINLEGVNFYFIGPGRNEAKRFFELKNFWTSFIEKSGGKVKNFGPEFFLNVKEIFESQK